MNKENELPKIEQVNPDDIKTDGKNPNSMRPEQLEALKLNIKKYGFLIPIITNKELLVADGEHRLQAAKSLNMKQVPVIRLDVEDVDRRMLRQILNKLRGEHDPEKDLGEYMLIMEQDRMQDFEELIAQPKENLLKLLDTKDQQEEDDDFDVDAELEKIKEPITQKGDVWKLGKHKLLCGDATQSEDYKKLLGTDVARMTFTDPPYNVDYGANKNHPSWKIRSIKGDKQNPEQWESFCKKFIANINQSNDGDIYVWHASSPEGMKFSLWLTNAFHWSATIIWNKDRLIMVPAKYHRIYEPCFYGWNQSTKSSYVGSRKEKEVWEIKRPGRNTLHPTMKPLELCRKAILNSSLADQIVLDPFGGSGSTLIACEQTLRQCRMIELDPRYCDVIVGRWERYTKQKAEKIVEAS